MISDKRTSIVYTTMAGISVILLLLMSVIYAQYTNRPMFHEYVPFADRRVPLWMWHSTHAVFDDQGTFVFCDRARYIVVVVLTCNVKPTGRPVATDATRTSATLLSGGPHAVSVTPNDDVLLILCKGRTWEFPIGGQVAELVWDKAWDEYIRPDSSSLVQLLSTMDKGASNDDIDRALKLAEESCEH